jgi:hypothetical protein
MPTPCALTQSLNLDCRDSFGGVKRVLLIEFDNVTAITKTANVITAITKASGKFFREYKLIVFTGDAKTDGAFDRSAGTSTFKQTVSFPINKMKTSIKDEIVLLAANRLLIIYEDNNGTYWLCGENFGMMMTTGSSMTGTALADRNGYMLTFEVDEKNFETEVSSSIITGLLT